MQATRTSGAIHSLTDASSIVFMALPLKFSGTPHPFIPFAIHRLILQPVHSLHPKFTTSLMLLARYSNAIPIEPCLPTPARTELTCSSSALQICPARAGQASTSRTIPPETRKEQVFSGGGTFI